MTNVDVLVFGPHPDDIEIGVGGAVATHVDLGYRVGLCDLTRGELGSNGTPEERTDEAQAAAEVLGATWRVNLEWPDGEIAADRRSSTHIRSAAELLRRCRPSVALLPYWRDRHPDHEAASRVVTEAVFRAGLRRFAIDGEPWKPDWTCYYFINDVSDSSFVIDVTSAYDRKRQALACHRSHFSRLEIRRSKRGSLPPVFSDDRIPRRTPRCVNRDRSSRGLCGEGSPCPVDVAQVMNIGIVCYASVGGSGIVATELAKALAKRGHQVRLISSDPPFRLGDFQAGLVFHEVKTPGYPLFREPQYLLSLANKLVEVAREFDLDIIHAHYAIPHAVARILRDRSYRPRVPRRFHVL